jgi:hypothetical protein
VARQRKKPWARAPDAPIYTVNLLLIKRTSETHMCVILTSGASAAGTRLLTYRAVGNPAQSRRKNVTAYWNRLDVHGDPAKRQLMIVPFPQDDPAARGSDFALGAPDSDADEARMWDMLETMFPKAAARGAPKPPTAPRPVQQVGGYKVALALNFAQLMDTPWHEFATHARLQERLADVRARFGRGYGFVVAQPSAHAETGKLGGTFAWTWYGEHLVLPTAHELQDDDSDDDAHGNDDDDDDDAGGSGGGNDDVAAGYDCAPTRATEYDFTGWIFETDARADGTLVFLEKPSEVVGGRVVDYDCDPGRDNAVATIADVLGPELAPAATAARVFRVDIQHSLPVNGNMAWIPDG